MKRQILGALPLLLIFATTVPAFGVEQTAVNPAASNSTQSYPTRINPFNLATLAYRGYFKDQGIPGYSSLILAYRAQEISAEDIVRSAVIDKRLSPEVLSDKKYVNSVRNELDALLIDNFNRR